MHLVVELLSETAIKHKKPFASLEWLGHASESIFLLDGGRTCILQVPSGGTKRHALRHRALYERLRSAVSTCVSADGALLAGISSDGRLFAWHRDSNSLRCVSPPPDFDCFLTLSASEDRRSSPQPSETGSSRLLTLRLFVDGAFERAVLLRPAGGSLLIWEDGQPPRWSLVTPPDHVPLPDAGCKEATVDTVFSRQVEGERWARCSLVFGTPVGLVASSVTLRWRPAAQLVTDGQSRFSARWSVLTVPWPQIHPRAALVRHSGALVARYSRGGQLLAVAVNQRDSDVTRLLYLGAAGGRRSVLAADLHGAGAAGVQRCHGRQYWVAGLSWLAGDALLAAVTKQGSLALLSALGEPVPLLVAGAEASGRPAPYLPLHSPLGTESAEAGTETAVGACDESPLCSARSEARPLRQRYSVAAHPHRPAFLCSSGYMVTLAEVKCHAPIAICDRFLSSAREMLVALKHSQVDISAEERQPLPPSTPTLKRRPVEGDGPTAEFNGRRARRAKHVSFADRLCSEATAERSRDELLPESAADWRPVRTLCGRLMSAQALTVSRPGRCTQEWAGRAAAVGRLSRQLAAAVLGGGCGQLGNPICRLQRLLPMLGRLAALAAFSDSGGHVTLASVGTLAALLEGTLRTCSRLATEDALSALSAVSDTLLSAELSQRRPDQSGRCVDQLERQQASALFSVTLPAGNPCSSDTPAALSPLWQRLLRATGRLYSLQRGRLTADQHVRLAVLLGQLQARVQQQRGGTMVELRLPRRTTVLRRYLAGDWVATEARLMAQLDSALAGRKPARRACRPALGLLYLHVSGGRLRRALETTDAALLRCAAGSAGYGSQLEAALRHPAGRRLLCSLARLMARYHLASPLSVQPPHDARPEPSLCSSAVLRRSVVVSRELLTADISSNYLTDVWNPQLALKLLISCGLLDEAVWFARELGDWRTALLISVLNNQLPSRKHRWPTGLSVEQLLSAQVASYLPLPAISLEVGSVRRLLLAALLAGVALVPDMLIGLAHLLRQPLLHMPCLVPARQPLPAVPLYLSAATSITAISTADQSLDPAGCQELQARYHLTEAVQKMLSVLRAAGLLERCTLHYLTTLKRACRQLPNEQAFRSPTLDASLEGTLRQLSAQLADDSSCKEQQQQVADAATYLRHLCLLLFLLHLRDMLTTTVRAEQSEVVPIDARAESVIQTVSLTATLQPLSIVAGWSADLAALALDAALGVDPGDQLLISQLTMPLAETLADLEQLTSANQQRLQQLLSRWGYDGVSPTDGDIQQALRSCSVGSGAQQLLNNCRFQQLQPSNQLQLLPDGNWLFSGLEDPSPLETQPPYLTFLRTVLDVAAPPGLVVTPAQPLLAGWRQWHERSQLASPAFVAGYRKMVVAADSGLAREAHKPADSTVGEAWNSFKLGAAPTLVSGTKPRPERSEMVSRSAGQRGEPAAAVRRGLFRCVSFNDIWRPTRGDEFFLACDRKEPRPRRQRRLRSRSADATVSSGQSHPSTRYWQTIPRQRTEFSFLGTGSAQSSGAGAGGDCVSLKHPAFHLSRGVSVPRLDKYERMEKLMGWFLLWRHREIRMDLVKSFSGPRIALRPSMPDILVYIWLTDHLTSGRGRGRGSTAPAPGLGGPAPTMEAEVPKVGSYADTSSSDDNAMFAENGGEDPMVRHRDELRNRRRNSGYGGRDRYTDQVSGYEARGYRQYGRPNTARPAYNNQDGQRGHQGGVDRYQTFEYPRPYSHRVGNHGYGRGPYRERGRNQNLESSGPGGFGQTEDNRFGKSDSDSRRFVDTGPYGFDEQLPRYDGWSRRPYDRPATTSARYGGSAPPTPRRRVIGQEAFFRRTSGADQVEKWGSWDDFRAAPVGMRAGHSHARALSAQPYSRAGAAAPGHDNWNNTMHTLVSPPGGPNRPPPELPAGWERRDRGVRQSTPPPPPLGVPAGTAPGWDKTMHAVRVGAAGAQWKQVHGLDKVEGDECFMVYDDKIVRMENFTADTGATIDVVEKVAVYSPTGSVSATSGKIAGTAGQLSRDQSASRTRGQDGAPCVNCEWQPWSSSNLGGQRQAQSAPPTRSSAASPMTSLQVPRSAAAGARADCVDCGEWQQWSASTLKSAAPASERTESQRDQAFRRVGSAGAVPSNSDISMSRQSERSDLISQLSDEVRLLRQEQRQLRRELAARSPSPVADVNVSLLTRLVDQINDALEVGLMRLQRGELWRPQSIHAPISLQPYVLAMKLPAPLLNAIVYYPESRYSSRPASRPSSRPCSGGSGVASVAEPDAGYRRMNAEQISQLVAEEVRKALREVVPGSGGAEGRQSRRRPRSTSPAPAREIIVHQPVRRTHSHDPKMVSPPSAPADGSIAGSDRQSSRSSSPPHSVTPGAAPPTAYRGYPFLLHLEDGGAAEQVAARQVRTIQESPIARKIIQLLHDTDPVSPGGEPDLVDRVLGIHKRDLEGMYSKKSDNMRVIQLLHDFSEDEGKADHRAAQEIHQLDNEIATLKRTLRALDSTEKLSVWHSPSDELRHLQEKMRQLDGGGSGHGVAAAEDVVATDKNIVEHEVVSEGTGSECKVKQPGRPDGRKHTQIVYDTDSKKSPAAPSGQPAERAVARSAAARSPSPGRHGRAKRLPGADGRMDVDLSEDEAPPPQRVRRRFVPAPNKPETSRSTPDAAAPPERPVAPLVSRSVFETTRAYQTSGEDRYIRAVDLEPAQSAPLATSSTADEIEVGSYTVSDADRRNMARPITTRDALGLAEGHDAEQQMSRERLTKTGGQQTRRRSQSPSPGPTPVTLMPAPVVPAPVTPVEVVPARGTEGPPVPSSTVPSDPVLRTVPSWGRETDAAAGVTSSVMKSYPSYLGTPEQQRPASNEEHVLEIGPIQVGISPNRIVDKLTDIGTKIGQAVGLVEQQGQDYDEVRQVSEREKKHLKSERQKRNKKHKKDTTKLLAEISDHPKKVPPERVARSVHWASTPVPEDMGHHLHTVERQKLQKMEQQGQQQGEKQKQQKQLRTQQHAELRKQHAAQQMQQQVELGKQQATQQKQHVEPRKHPAEQMKQQTNPIKKQTELRNRQAEPGKQQDAKPRNRQPVEQDMGWFPVALPAFGQILATSPEEEDDESERELSNWLPFFGVGGGGGGGAPLSPEEPGDWKPFQTRQSPVSLRSPSPAKVDPSDYRHGGIFTPGIRGRTGNIQQQKRMGGVVPSKTIGEKSSSFAELSQKTAQSEWDWDRPASTPHVVAASASVAEHRRRRSSLQGSVRPTDDRRHQKGPTNRHAPDASSSLIITHSSLQAVHEESDSSGRFQPGAPIVPRASAERATNRSSSSLSSGTEADDERAPESAPRRKASPALRRPMIRRPGERPGSAASSRASERADDDDDDLSSWRVPSAVYRLLGEGGTSSSDETNPATDQLLYSIFGTEI